MASGLSGIFYHNLLSNCQQLNQNPA